MAVPLLTVASGGAASSGTARWNPSLALLGLAVAAALAGLPFLRVAPNRLLSGEPFGFSAFWQGPLAPAAAVAVAVLAALCAGAFTRPRRAVLWTSAVGAAALVPGWLALAAAQAALVAQTQSPIARTSLGAAFWVALLLSALMAADALQRLRAGPLARGLVACAAVLPLMLLLVSGAADALSLMKEYANRADVFWPAVVRHLQIVGMALLLALGVGLPLGWAARRWARVAQALFPVLNIVQTIPSIALFGLLMAPLAWVAASLPSLGRAGISGVGLAPGVIALALYSLLPVVRGVLTGLAQVPTSALEAASGMGMSRAQMFWHVEVPLAWPVVLGGVRTATIQAVGLAAVTALIGAGGLGALMFEGLFSSAQDLVLLGVVPLVVLGALVDVLFRGLVGLGAPAVPSPGKGVP